MNQVITHNNRTLALLSKFNEIDKDNNTEWFGKESEPLQGSRMSYNAGKTFKTHKHKLNPRIINRTQEAFVVIRGKIQIDVFESYDDYLYVCHAPFTKSIKKGRLLGSLVAEAGDIIFVWGEFHKISILEDNTVCYELKAGQFTSVEEDKEFLDV